MTETLPPRKAKNSRRGRRIGCGLLVALVAVLAWLAFADDPLPDDSDFLLTPSLPPSSIETVVDGIVEISVALDALEAKDLIITSAREFQDAYDMLCVVDDLDDPSLWPRQQLEEDAIFEDLVAESAEIAAEWRKALEPLPAILERPHFGDLARTGFLGYRNPLRRVSDTLATLAAVARANGELNECRALLQQYEELAKRGFQSASPDIGALLGAVYTRESAYMWESLLHDRRFRSADVFVGFVESSTEEIARTVRQFVRGTYSLAWKPRILSTELTTARLDVIPLGTQFYRPHRTLGSVLEICRQVHAAPVGPEKRALFVELTRRVEHLGRRALFRRNSGEYLLEEYAVEMENSIGLLEHAAVTHAAVRLLCALRIHEDRAGTLPPDLESLRTVVPELSAVPTDVHAAAPFRYDPERRIVWSVGPDGVDDGASEWETIRDDPTFDRDTAADLIFWLPPLAGTRR